MGIVSSMDFEGGHDAEIEVESGSVAGAGRRAYTERLECSGVLCR